MLSDELLIVAGYCGMAETIRTVCRRLEVEPTILRWEYANDEFLLELQKRFQTGNVPDVIIARGALANMVERFFRGIVLIRAEPSEMDILTAVRKATAYGERIGLLLQERYAATYQLQPIKELFGLQTLVVYPFQSREDIVAQINKGKQEGMDVMAGGGTLAVRTGKAVGIPVCLAETGEFSMESAIHEALAVLRVLRQKKEYLDFFHSASASVNEGILVTDGEQILFTNEIIGKIFRTGASLVGKTVRGLPDIFFPGGQTLSDLLREPDAESIINICGVNYLVHKCAHTHSGTKQTLLVFANADNIQLQEQRIRNTLYAKGLIAKYVFQDIQAESDVMRSVIARARQYAQTNANILISGESGTGKELFAQSIHNASSRAKGPFVAINCASIPENLLESELFGYEEGSFSGAKKGGKPGLFELSHNGTIFLDEIDSLPTQLQGALLRVLQEKEIHRIGSQRNVAVNIRVIAAANKDMKRLLAEKAFRPDLYYRLNTLHLTIPPLCLRDGDVLPLADYFIRRYASFYQVEPPALRAQDRQLLLRHRWPGNVRELENAMHRFVILTQVGQTAVEGCLDAFDSDPSAQSSEEDIYTIRKGSLDDMERELIRQALRDHGANRGETARFLGISRSTLWKKLSQGEDEALSGGGAGEPDGKEADQ